MKTERRTVRCGFFVCSLLILGVLVAPAQAPTYTDWVEMPDGVRLLTDFWIPTSGGPAWPVVLIRTPYPRDEWHVPPAVFVDNGYAVVIQSLRGRYGSEGEFRMHLDNHVDGYTTIEWIAQQLWCDGNIGMIGLSGLAVPQFRVMHDAPPALKCLAPERSSPDGYHFLWFQGGAFREELDQLFCFLFDLPDVCAEALLHRLLDSWWDPWMGLVEPELVHVPMLHIGGWYDFGQQATLDTFTFFQHGGGAGAAGNQYLIMDPLDHNYGFGELPRPPDYFPAGDGDYYPQHTLAWMDHWLKQEPSGVDEWPSVRVYLMGACEEPDSPGCIWVDLDDWPPVAETRSFYLAEDWTLSESIPAPGQRSLVIDPNDPVFTLGGANSPTALRGPYDQRPREVRDDVLVFTTDVLAQPVYVMGPVTARIWIRPDTPDLDLSVRLTDVYPDGRSMLIIDGIQRARKRCGDAEECFMISGEAYEIEVELWSTAMVFNAGHRIRVAIAGTNWDRFEINSNDGGDLNNPNYIEAYPEILFGPQYPSAILLPFPVLFADSFETGDTSAWSAVVP